MDCWLAVVDFFRSASPAGTIVTKIHAEQAEPMLGAKERNANPAQERVAAMIEQFGRQMDELSDVSDALERQARAQEDIAFDEREHGRKLWARTALRQSKLYAHRHERCHAIIDRLAKLRSGAEEFMTNVRILGAQQGLSGELQKELQKLGVSAEKLHAENVQFHIDQKKLEALNKEATRQTGVTEDDERDDNKDLDREVEALKPRALASDAELERFRKEEMMVASAGKQQVVEPKKVAVLAAN